MQWQQIVTSGAQGLHPYLPSPVLTQPLSQPGPWPAPLHSQSAARCIQIYQEISNDYGNELKKLFEKYMQNIRDARHDIQTLFLAGLEECSKGEHRLVCLHTKLELQQFDKDAWDLRQTILQLRQITLQSNDLHDVEAAEIQRDRAKKLASGTQHLGVEQDLAWTLRRELVVRIMDRCHVELTVFWQSLLHQLWVLGGRMQPKCEEAWQRFQQEQEARRRFYPAVMQEHSSFAQTLWQEEHELKEAVKPLHERTRQTHGQVMEVVVTEIVICQEDLYDTVKLSLARLKEAIVKEKMLQIAFLQSNGVDDTTEQRHMWDFAQRLRDTCQSVEADWKQTCLLLQYSAKDLYQYAWG